MCAATHFRKPFHIARHTARRNSSTREPRYLVCLPQLVSSSGALPTALTQVTVRPQRKHTKAPNTAIKENMGPSGAQVAKAASGEVTVSPPDRPDYDKGKAAEVIKRLKAGGRRDTPPAPLALKRDEVPFSSNSVPRATWRRPPPPRANS
jgi:hypothetical protein